MSERIKHIGVVDSVEDAHVRVRIVQASACASCKVAGHCNTSDAKEKIVDVYTRGASYTVGQEVTVTASATMARQALALGFILPFILLVATLIAIVKATENEAFAALCSVGILIPYYATVWLFRDRIAKRIAFQIE